MLSLANVKLTDQTARVLHPTVVTPLAAPSHPSKSQLSMFGGHPLQARRAAIASDIAEQDRHSEGEVAPERRRLSDSVKAIAMAACVRK